MRGNQGWRAASALAVAAAIGAAGCGGDRQDANEKSGTYRVQVVSAKFPAKQSISDATKLTIKVRNADSKPLPNVSVTIETKTIGGASAGESPAFSYAVNDPRLAINTRPVWIVDQEPSGGETANTNTWALGRLAPGATRTFRWRLTAVQPGEYSVSYAVSPGLYGKAKPAAGSGTGKLHVRIDGTPANQSVGPDGKVVSASD
jgi:hypothetical protein